MTENRCIEVLKKMKHMFTETCAKIDDNTALDMAVEAIEEIQQYRAIGTVEEIKATKEKLQGYKNQMSIYAEQHKIILASDVLDMLEELDWSE